jgi:hypothetical protein
LSAAAPLIASVADAVDQVVPLVGVLIDAVGRVVSPVAALITQVNVCDVVNTLSSALTVTEYEPAVVPAPEM